jgi:hypothetical protein
MKDTLSINPNPKKTVEYVNNQEFYDALVIYIDSCRKATQEGKERPLVSNYLAECILKIAQGMARRPNFANYSWKEEMIGDAVENCLKYIDKFDYQNYKNPFGYFSQACWYSFLGRIALEKKQSKVKREIVRWAGVDTFALQDHDETGEFTMNLQEFLAGIGDDEPTSVIKQHKDDKPGALEGFME